MAGARTTSCGGACRPTRRAASRRRAPSRCRPRDALAFGPDLIHSVVNPSAKVTGAIHVYGGDFFAIERSEWDPDLLEERPYDTEKARRMFAR